MSEGVLISEPAPPLLAGMPGAVASSPPESEPHDALPPKSTSAKMDHAVSEWNELA